VAYYSGAAEVIGFVGDETNMHPSHKQAGDKMYTKLVPSIEKCMFEFYRNRELFNYVLGKEVKIEAPYIRRPALSEEKRNKHILIFPGAGDEIRKWSVTNYKQLSKELQDIYKLPILVCGPANERNMGDRIAVGQEDKVVNTVGKYNLEETLNIVQSAKFVVTGDTGAMHIALALGTPAVCISNGNFYQRFCPYPGAMHKPLTVVYSDEFEKLVQNNPDAVRCAGSNADVNAISVDKVITAMKNNIKL
jgi:ADP-heptose:LPS heptosyltransferase